LSEPEGRDAGAVTPDPVELVGAAMAADAGRGLDAIRQLRPLLDAWERDQVQRARDEGWNWAEIAKRLGRHRQAVHREYANRRHGI
jgi:transcriptional regulator with GAF, ATPase, and Fis domain